MNQKLHSNNIYEYLWKGIIIEHGRYALPPFIPFWYA